MDTNCHSEFINQNLSFSFLPHRFVFEGGGAPAEGFVPEGAEGGGGVSEAASEAVAEELRKAAAAQKKDSKREKKARKRDGSLAQLIEQFIHAGGDQDAIVLLIARLLKRNTPIAVVIAILSINYPEFQSILADHIKEEHIPKLDEDFDHSVNALVPLGQDLTQALDSWADLIYTHASFYPLKTITALADHAGVNSSCLQLSGFMIQEFLQSKGKQDIEFENIKKLSDTLWRSILKKVHKLCEEQELLEAPEDESKSDEDED
jgi:hypothetical protein